MLTSNLLERLRNDLQLAVISVVGVLAVATILPFLVYRLATGELVIAAVDAVIIAGISYAVTRTWRGGSIERAGLLMALVTSASCMLVSLMFARHGLLWSYVVFTTNFILTERRYAVLANAALLLLLALHPEVFSTTQERLVFIATGTLVSAMAFLFAMHAASQRQQMVALASRDTLTGASNRLAMQSELQPIIQLHLRSQRPCGIAMLDLDRFKRLNDSFGHDAGDRALVDFARLATQACRRQDRLYRLGGEEFVMLFPETPAEGLRAVLEKLRTRVAEQLRAPDGTPITVSAGAALLDGESDWPPWLARADSALYRAKARGRNTVVLDTDCNEGEAPMPQGPRPWDHAGGSNSVPPRAGKSS